MSLKNRFGTWVHKHYRTMMKKPTNGRKSSRQLDALLDQIRTDRRRIIRASSSMMQDTQTVKNIVEETNNAVGPSSDNHA